MVTGCDVLTCSEHRSLDSFAANNDIDSGMVSVLGKGVEVYLRVRNCYELEIDHSSTENYVCAALP